MLWYESCGTQLSYYSKALHFSILPVHEAMDEARQPNGRPKQDKSRIRGAVVAHQEPAA
jgi:hypothetical protein